MSQDNTSNPTPPVNQSIDTSKIVEDVSTKVSSQYEEKFKELESSVESKASQLAEEKVSKMKEDLIRGFSGDKEPKWAWEKEGRKDPKTWDQLMEETEKLADKKAEEKIKQWQEQNEKVQSERQKTEAQRLSERTLKFSKQWFDLVQNGKMAEPAPHIMAKIKSGQAVSEEEAVSDRGIIEYRKLVKQALERNDDNLKVTYYEKFSQPEVDAPIFGSDNIFGSPARSEEYSYEEIHNS